MREFVFTVRFEPDVDRLMDAFIEHPDARAHSTACAVTRDRMWRVDHLVGHEDALDQIEDRFLDEGWCNECLHAPNCESAREYRVLSRDPTHRVVYTRRAEIDRCHSVPYLAVDELGDGLLFRADRRAHRYDWRVLLPEESEVGALYDAVQSRLMDGVEVDLRHVGECSDWSGPPLVATRLSPEQREAITLAVDRGYYATPREVTLADLSEELSVPRSTFQYRLRQAERRVIEAVVDAS